MTGRTSFLLRAGAASLVLLTGCQMGGKGEVLGVRGVAGDALELAWTPPGEGDYDLRVFGRGNQELRLERKGGRGFASFEGLEPGEYNFRLCRDTPSGTKIISSRKVKVSEPLRSSQILKPEDFGLKEPLGLRTLLAFPGAEGGELFRNSLRELRTVARNLAEIFLGPAYPVEEESQVFDIERARSILLQQRYRLAHGFAARALLVVDIRLPESGGEVPCQLSLRLFDVTHPRNDNEFLWNLRPLIYEDFVEVPRFRPGESNYDALVRALGRGLGDLRRDPMVLSYTRLVAAGGSGEVDMKDLWQGIGRRIPLAEGRKGILEANHLRAEELMFPVNPPGSEGPALAEPEPAEAGGAPRRQPAASEPAPEKPVPEPKPTIPVFKPGEPEPPGKKTRPDGPEPKRAVPGATEPKPGEPAPKPAIPVFQPRPDKPATEPKSAPKPAPKKEPPEEKKSPKTGPPAPKPAIPIFDPRRQEPGKSPEPGKKPEEPRRDGAD